MGMFLIKVKTRGDAFSYNSVAIEADTVREAMEEYDKNWYPGIFTTAVGIGTIQIEYITSFQMKEKGKSYSELHDGE